MGFIWHRLSYCQYCSLGCIVSTVEVIKELRGVDYVINAALSSSS